MHVISRVLPGSIGEELELEPGDVLVSINGQPVEDVFDYRYLMNDEVVELLIRKKNGEEWELEVEKDYEDDLGVEFENSLMDDYRSCSNHCIFCFIDQMPPNMRETLYFKDDDSRLSFLQGNYVTLTNMSDHDLDRIIQYHLSPINISFQTMNPELRCKMLNNRFAGEALKKVDRLNEAGIEMNGQIVLCKGVNDGEELAFSIREMMRYIPNLQSVSVVPVGLSKYRDGLFPLEPFTREDAREVLSTIHYYQNESYQKYGNHFIHASDEWYITAERDFPEEERYDGYIQLENGVGMMRLFIEEFEEAVKHLEGKPMERTLTIATGKLTYPTICQFAERLTKLYPGLVVHVYAIRNDFFGETITVSGLITGQDLVKQLLEYKEWGVDLGETLLIPSNMLRTGEEVFLDDMTVQQVEEVLGMHLTAIEPGGQDFVDAVLDEGYQMERENEEFVYVNAYDR